MLNSENTVLERLESKHLFNHLLDNYLLSSLQSGFLPGDSTVNQLTFLYNTFCQALDSSKEVRTVFCDISKTFDRVWHAGLLAILQATGVLGKIHAWFADYLSDRKQRGVLPGAVSDWTYIRAGVPQGSVLGRLLFLLYINDIVNDIGSNVRLFADDTSLFIIVDDHVIAADCINADLGRISNWASTWLITFNPVGGRVVRWSWVSFQCRGVLLVWIRVGQGPTALAIGAGGGCLDIFTLLYPFSPLSPSLWETTQYRLKYCLKGSLSPKTTNQLTFNPSKTETLLISRKLYRPLHPPLFMQNHQISEVDSHKHLGLYFSNDCTWHQNILQLKHKLE